MGLSVFIWMILALYPALRFIILNVLKVFISHCWDKPGL